MTFNVTTVDILAGRVEVQGTLEGVAPGGAFKVPAVFLYPVAPSVPNNVGIFDLTNMLDYEVFGGATFVFDLMRIYAGSANGDGDDWIVNQQGYSYLAIQWYKLGIDAQVANAAALPHFPATQQAVPFDATWAIAQATDQDVIMQAASDFLRNPVMTDPLVLNPPAAPAAGNVCAFGCGNTASAMRDFYFRAQNSALGGAFPGGLVFDGACFAETGAVGRTPNNVLANRYASYVIQPGETPVAQGPVLSLPTETEMILGQGYRARPAAPVAHYKQCECAGVSHLSIGLIEFISTIQCKGSPAPSCKAMMVNMTDHVVNATPLPPDVFMAGSPATRATPFLTGTTPLGGAPWAQGFTTETFTLMLGSDGNALGGMRQPHLRTILTNGAEIGGPIGRHRGAHCIFGTIEDALLPDAGLNCPEVTAYLNGNEFYHLIAGLTDDYQRERLNQLYPRNSLYTGLVSAAAEHARDQRWLLGDDITKMVADALASGIGR